MVQYGLEKKFHDTYSELLESYKQLKDEIKVRKQAEDEIVRQKKYIESIINCSVDGILAYDRKFRFTAWNPGMEYISGVNKSEALGKNAFRLFPFLKKIGEDKYFKKSLQGRTVVSRNRPYIIPKTGRRGYFEARYSPLFNENGDIIGGLSVVRDITKYTQDNEKLRYQASLISNVSDAILSVDNKLLITSWNKGASHLYGWKEKEIIGKPIREFIKTKYPSEPRDKIMSTLEKKGYWKGEILQLTKNGQWINILSSSSLLKNIQGEVIGVVSVAKDITQMKKAENRIAHLASFPELNPNPVGEIDLSGKIIYLNPIAKKIFPNLVKLGVRHLWLTDFNKLTKELTSKKKNFITRELKIGKIYFEQLIYYLADKQLLRIYGIDITERKNKEEKIQHQAELLKIARDELEKKVKERTKELIIAIQSLKKEISERMQAEKAVKSEQKRLNNVLETLPAYVVLLTPDYHVSFANRFFRERFGESEGKRCFEYLFNRKEPCENCETYKVLKTGKSHFWEWTGPDGRIYSIYDYPFKNTDGSTYILEMGLDITRQKQAEETLKKINVTLEQRVVERTAALQRAHNQLEDRVRDRTYELADAYQEVKKESEERKEAERRIRVDNKLLKLLGKAYTRKKYLDEVLKLIKIWSGCQCAGIRVLNQSGDIPYETYYGFTKKFWESENWLNVNSDQCACIRVVKGEPEPEDTPALTREGSFRTDNSFKFLSGVPRRCQKKYRGVCIRSGFASIAIIPIRYSGKTYGAIHLADKQEGKVPPKTIAFIESIAPLIGEGMHKFEMQDSLKKNYDMLEKFFSSAHVLVAFMDKDFNFIRVNRAYAGAGDYPPEFYIGKNHFELFPDKENEGIFKQAVRSGETFSVMAKPFRYQNQPEKGTTFWDWTLQPLKDRAGNVTELLLALVDVTDQTKAANKLLKSYRYIGVIDRKISTLMRFFKQKGISGIKNISNVIVDCAMQLSEAKTGVLYYYNKQTGKFNLISSTGGKFLPSLLSVGDFNFLHELSSNRARKQTIILKTEDISIKADPNLKYFLAIPLFNYNILKGIVMLGFPDRDSLTHQELKFYEVFIEQASSLLAGK